ncbi:MAG: hypothetical protein IPN46_08260 [Saprospiraceae bacterium]|nr:hypothetical protein [Saprospiraceae bacterium]
MNYFKIRNLLALVVITMQFCHLDAQTLYEYSKFRFPEVKVKGLTGTAFLGGNDNSLRFISLSSLSNQFNYNIRGSYFMFENTSTKQKIDNWSLINYFDRSWSDKNVLQPRTLDQQFFVQASKSQINRKYSKLDFEKYGFRQKFSEVNHILRISYSKLIEKNDNFDSNTNYTSAFASLPIKMGYGRIEPMTDVFLAQFLMDDLLAAGVISQKFTEDELFDLAQTMGKIKNVRVFDYRRANIYQLTELSRWMERNDIPQNIQSFTILNDNWQSASIFQRQHGKRISLGVVPWTEYSKINNLDDKVYYGAGLELDYFIAKPLSQYSQSDFNINLSYDFQADNLEDIARLSTGYKYSYNPNSRTTYAISPSANLLFTSFDDIAFSLSLPVSFSYFINNRSRISGNFGIRYYHHNDNLFYSPIRIENTFYTSNNFDFHGLNQLENLNIFSGKQLRLYGNLSFNYAFF